MTADAKQPRMSVRSRVREHPLVVKVRSVAHRLDVRILVVVICAVAAAVAVSVGQKPFSDWESQLFWLAVNVLVVTLAIGALLDSDLRRRRRDELQFGFQARLVLLIQELLKLVDQLPDALPGPPVSAIGSLPQEFEHRLAGSVRLIVDAKGIHEDMYDSVYPTVWMLLDDLGRNFVRLFSEERPDMVTNYKELLLLGHKWRYISELSPGALSDISRMKENVKENPGDEFAVKSLNGMMEGADKAKKDALSLLVDTGNLLFSILQQSAGPLIELAP